MRIIAEAGVNHNGDPDLAIQLVQSAAKAGADFVKFQTFQADKLVTRAASKAAYQSRNLGQSSGGTQYDMLKALELSHDLHFELKKECTRSGIQFLSTPFDIDSALFLTDTLGESVVKVGSGDMDNFPLLITLARRGVDVILSTGMSNLAEVELSLGALAFGYLSEKNARPSQHAFLEAYGADDARAVLRSKVTVLHCTTEYPAPAESLNLRAMTTMAQAFGVPTGFSDHSMGDEAAIAALVLGASMLEKHITLDRRLEGPDHKASMEPAEFARLITALRNTSIALGDGVKCMAAAEIANKGIARKSPVAAQSIAAGEVFTEENLTLKRTPGGQAASQYYELIGKAAHKSFEANEVIL